MTPPLVQPNNNSSVMAPKNWLEATSINDKVLDCYLATPLLACSNTMLSQNLRFSPLQHTSLPSTKVTHLDQAHKRLERLHGIINIAEVSRYGRQKFEEQKKQAINQIIESIDKIGDYGILRGLPQVFRFLVDGGNYLKILQIYFSRYPKKLIGRDELNQQQNTLLHCATRPQAHYSYSPSFFVFVLNSDKTHNLGMSRLKNSWEKYPIDLLPPAYESSESELKQRQMLLEHEASLPLVIIEPTPVPAPIPTPAHMPIALPNVQAVPEVVVTPSITEPQPLPTTNFVAPQIKQPQPPVQPQPTVTSRFSKFCKTISNFISSIAKCIQSIYRWIVGK